MKFTREALEQALADADPIAYARLLNRLGQAYKSGKFELAGLRSIVDADPSSSDEFIRRTALEVLAFDFLETDRIELVWKILSTDPSELCRAAAALLIGSHFQSQRSRSVVEKLLKIREDDSDPWVKSCCLKAAFDVIGDLDSVYISDLERSPEYRRRLLKEIREKISTLPERVDE